MGLFEALSQAYTLRDARDRTEIARQAQEQNALAEQALAQYRNASLAQQGQQFDVTSQRADRALNIEEEQGGRRLDQGDRQLDLTAEEQANMNRYRMGSLDISRGQLGVAQSAESRQQRAAAQALALRAALGGGQIPPEYAAVLTPETVALIQGIPPTQRAAILTGGNLTPEQQVEQMVAGYAGRGAPSDDPGLQDLIKIRTSMATAENAGRSQGFNPFDPTSFGGGGGAPPMGPLGGGEGAALGSAMAPQDPLGGLKAGEYADQLIQQLEQAVSAGVDVQTLRKQGQQPLAALASQDMREAQRVAQRAVDLGIVRPEELQVQRTAQPPAGGAGLGSALGIGPTPGVPGTTPPTGGAPPAATPLAPGASLSIPQGAYALPSGVAPPPTAHGVPTPGEVVGGLAGNAWGATSRGLGFQGASPGDAATALRQLYSGQAQSLDQALQSAIAERLAREGKQKPVAGLQ